MYKRFLGLKKTVSVLFMLSLFLLSCTNNKRFYFETTYLRIGIDPKGDICSLTDKKTGTDYFPEGQSAPLLSLFKDSIYIDPDKFEYDSADHQISLYYPNKCKATIAVDNKGDYLRLKLLSLEPGNGTQAVVWGPYPTTIGQSIGETVCVVRDSAFAFGLQALNINTTEGLPGDRDGAGGGEFIDPLPGQQLPDSLKDKIGQRVDINVDEAGDIPPYVRIYRGSAAVKTAYGSKLQLFSRDRRMARTVGSGNDIQEVPPINGDFIGSSIAMFGCPTSKTLDIIGEIEVKEGLPHPMLHGVWIKKSRIPGEAYMMYEGNRLDSAIAYAKDCGFSRIHLGTIFKSWGHFGLKTNRFPEGVKSVKKWVAEAAKNGITLGLHTLTMFTTTNDPYVTPIPSDSLCKTGSSVLTRAISPKDSVIYIKSPVFFRDLSGTRTVKIGKELVNYRNISNERPWRLMDCVRGAFGTKVSAHLSGAEIDKLVNNGYGGFYPDIYLQDKYAGRLADVCNETGIGLMDFDGFGGGSPTGQGCYGAAKFIDEWYKHLDHDVLVCGASTFHFFWHIYAFMNWGEPWYNDLRHSQVNYRLENQRYFSRNLMPHMLGWFSLAASYRPEDVEWIQARSAGFDAGYLLRIGDDIDKNGFKYQLFALIKQWQKARSEHAFTAAQKIELQNPKNEFHLEKVSDSSWNLYPVNLVDGLVYKFRSLQPGQPVSSDFHVNNPYKEQPIRFYIVTKPTKENNTDASIGHLTLQVNGYQTLSINTPLKDGNNLFCDGKNVWLCNNTWQKLKELNVTDIPKLSRGNNDIQVQSTFLGNQAPELIFDFESIGPPEHVGK